MNVKKTFIIILLFLVLFSATSSAADDKSYTIDHAFIDLTIVNNGLLHVDERFDYSFDGSFNGVYRDIPLKSGESIENINVSADGAYPVLVESDDNGYKHLKIYLYSDAAHTEGISNCDVRVYISYDMKNVVTLFNDVGALQYKLWGEEWDVGVGEVQATVTLPGNDGNEYFLNPQEYNSTSEIKGNEITAKSTSIPKGEFYELLVLMPLNDFVDAGYAKHVNQDGKDMIIKNHEDSVNDRNFWNSTYIILALLSILSPIGALLTYLKFGREPKVSYDGIYERDLPSDDPPEVINALVENKQNIGTPNMKGFESSIMNMIDRKIIHLSTRTSENTNLNELILTFDHERVNELSASEKIVFNALAQFAYDGTLNLSRLDDQLSSKDNARLFMDQVEDWKNSVRGSMNTKEFFNNTGSRIINIIGIGGIVFGAIITFLGLVTNLGNGIYAVVAGVLLIIFSIAIKFVNEDIFGKWTENGRVFYLKWNNFKKFLKDNSLMKEHPPESIVIWKKYLIYGTALGVADKVYESMKLQVPDYLDYNDDLFYYHYYGGYGMIYSAYHTGQETLNPSSDSGGFGGLGGGSGGGGGGAF